MTYPMPPGLRIPYDVDGTIGFVKRGESLGGNLFQVHPNGLRALNGINASGMYVSSAYWSDGANANDYYTGYGVGVGTGEGGMSLLLIFPVPTRLRGFFFTYANSEAGDRDNHAMLVQVSKDTTNGVDGTWSAPVSYPSEYITRLSSSGVSAVDAISGVTSTPGGSYRPPREYYRTVYDVNGTGIREFTGGTYRNVKAIRLFPQLRVFPTDAAGHLFLHLYGEPDTGALGADYLQGWRADSDMRLGGATLSWGDAPLGSSDDIDFRIKNQSTDKTANSVLVYASDDILQPTPTPASQLLFSLDGATWTTTVTLGAIGPETISPVIHMRRVTPSGALLGSWSPKVRFDVGSWS